MLTKPKQYSNIKVGPDNRREERTGDSGAIMARNVKPCFRPRYPKCWNKLGKELTL